MCSTCIPSACRCQKRVWVPTKYNYIGLWATMLVPGSESGSCLKATSACTCWEPFLIINRTSLSTFTSELRDHRTKEVERLWVPEDREEYCEMLSFWRGTVIICTNSWYPGLSEQNQASYNSQLGNTWLPPENLSTVGDYRRRKWHSLFGGLAIRDFLHSIHGIMHIRIWAADGH